LKKVEIIVTFEQVPDVVDPVDVGRSARDFLLKNEDSAIGKLFKVEIPARGLMEPYKDAGILQEIEDLKSENNVFRVKILHLYRLLKSLLEDPMKLESVRKEVELFDIMTKGKEDA
jgi:hypothetical protein